jgi:hypothetical protein
MICLTLIDNHRNITRKILVNKEAIILCVEDKSFLDDGKCTRVELTGKWTFYVNETMNDILKMWK